MPEDSGHAFCHSENDPSLLPHLNIKYIISQYKFLAIIIIIIITGSSEPIHREVYNYAS